MACRTSGGHRWLDDFRLSTGLSFRKGPSNIGYLRYERDAEPGSGSQCVLVGTIGFMGHHMQMCKDGGGRSRTSRKRGESDLHVDLIACKTIVMSNTVACKMAAARLDMSCPRILIG